MSTHNNSASRLAPLIAILLILVFLSSLIVTGRSAATPAAGHPKGSLDQQPIVSAESTAIPTATSAPVALPTATSAPAAVPAAVYVSAAVTSTASVPAAVTSTVSAPATPRAVSATPEAPAVVSKDRPAAEPTRATERRSLVALPKSIRFPSVGVATGIEEVGATADGGMDVPADPARAGWYRYGPRPGDAGNAAIAGHVDWGGRVMPFWNLNRLKIGDPVEIVAADGRTIKFEVRWSRWFDAEDDPTAEIFANTGVPEVTLVTCGGIFDPTTRQYSQRLVVRASLSD